MPEDAKKNQSKKGKNDAKEQRKPRQPRQQSYSTKAPEKKIEKNVTESKVPEKPAFVDPGPDFYKNLKRETDEILKITEEATTKYKKKEIQSNWAKYEIPVETYDEIDELENMGADYEKLAGAPLSTGGYFQFKHEKSWDIDTEPSLYDKFFEIDMDNLAIAIQTIPFHERNSINKCIFSETDVQNMNNRSIRFKQKYYKDNSYTTPELEVHDKILNSLRDSNKPDNNRDGKSLKHERNEKTDEDPIIDLKEKKLDVKNNKIELSNEIRIENNNLNREGELNDRNKEIEIQSVKQKESNDKILQDIQLPKLIANKFNKVEHMTETNKIDSKPTSSKSAIDSEDLDDLDDIILGNDGTVPDAVVRKPVTEIKNIDIVHNSREQSKGVKNPVPEQKSNPVIESPEDLEKWLDDFLDS